MFYQPRGSVFMSPHLLTTFPHEAPCLSFRGAVHVPVCFIYIFCHVLSVEEAAGPSCKGVAGVSIVKA